ncbi:hypothetical protein [Haloferula sp. A504]|uniref:hypothetical protein n=1 Tax=Haloferula sp. A504 TaxID=3373601 RepID=UPI0031C1DCCC|nr:hypothetical protein [Verrucomicrobiaceae bacterium E54]
MKKLDSTLLDEALNLLAELTSDHPPQHWVVCGGSSLLALGLVSRDKTRDVDVLARAETDGLVNARPLPDWLYKAAEEVGSQLGLLENWFNTGPSDDSFFRFGFPEGMAARLIPRDYGPDGNLRISFISRYDQIFFKLYATADSDAGRHYEDLQDLQPTAEELLAAARWTRTQDPSEGFLFVLGGVLKALGHEPLLAQL